MSTVLLLLLLMRRQDWATPSTLLLLRIVMNRQDWAVSTLLLLLRLHLPLHPLGCLGRRCLGLGRFLGDCRLLRRVLADGTDLGLELLDLVLELALFAKVEDERLLKLLFSPG